jgi:hypothetical protein
VKLLNVNTFESEDYGIGLRQSVNTSTLSGIKIKRNKSAAATHHKKSLEAHAAAGGTGGTPSDPSSMKILVSLCQITVLGSNKILRHKKVRENIPKLRSV